MSLPYPKEFSQRFGRFTCKNNLVSVLGDLLAIDCKLNFVYLLRKGWDIDMYTRKAMLGNGCVFLPTFYFPIP